MQLGRLGVAGHRGQRRQVVDAEHPEPRRPLDQQVQQVGGGEGVVERPVRRLVVQAEPRRQRAEAAVGHLVAHQPPGQRDRIDAHGVEARVAGALEGVAQERHVEPDVVTDEDRAAEELEQRRQHGLDARRRRDQRVGEAGEHGDLRRDRPPRVDQRLERAEELAASDLDRADLGDRVVRAVAAGGLEVEHAERHVGQRRAEVVEAALDGPSPNCRCHEGMTPRTLVRVKRPFVDQVFGVGGCGRTGTSRRP